MQGNVNQKIAAAEIPIVDAGNKITATEVEGALQEIAGTVGSISSGLGGIQVFTASGTFTAPKTGKYKITCTGGGGSGGYGTNCSSGGGAGGTAIKYIDLTVNTQVTVTIGTGGAIPNGSSYGNVGTASTFGAYVTGSGGSGGGYRSGNVGSGGIAGGAGGAATGGDVNITGGCGHPAYSSSYNGAGFDSKGGESYWSGFNYSGNCYGSGGSGGNYTGSNGIIVVEW